MFERGLFVGRFQPFHLGHLGAARDILKEVNEIVVAVGSAQYSHSLHNPFTAGERLVMIRRALEEAGIDDNLVWIVPVPDVHLHMMWVSAVEGYVPRFSAVFTNEPLTRRLFTEAGYRVREVRFHQRKRYSSTEIRKRMLKGEDWQELAPKSVVNFINEISGVDRLRDLAKDDKP